MKQTTKNGVVFTEPAEGKFLRIKGTNVLASRAADYEDKVPEYEEVEKPTELNGEANNE